MKKHLFKLEVVTAEVIQAESPSAINAKVAAWSEHHAVKEARRMARDSWYAQDAREVWSGHIKDIRIFETRSGWAAQITYWERYQEEVEVAE